MKTDGLKRTAMLLAIISSSVSATDETGWGRDDDTPGAQPQPPAETESITTETLLQQILEWFDVSADQ